MNLRKLVILLLMAVVLAGICFSIYSGGSICVIRNITGLPCPGCGMTRALIALSKLEFTKAVGLHPLSLMMLPFGGLLALSPFNRSLRRLIGNKVFWQLLIAIFLVVYIVRMFLMFPHIEPMTLLENAYLLRIFTKN